MANVILIFKTYDLIILMELSYPLTRRSIRIRFSEVRSYAFGQFSFDNFDYADQLGYEVRATG